MDGHLISAVAQLNRLKTRSAAVRCVLLGMRAVLLALMMISIWALIRPHAELEQLGLGALSFFIAATLSFRPGTGKIQANDLALALEMQHSATTPTRLTEHQHLSADWQSHLNAWIRQEKTFAWRGNLSLASTMLLPLLVCFVTFPHATPSIKLAFKEVSNAVASLSRGANLRIIQGATSENQVSLIPLQAGKPIDIELLAQNLIELNVIGGGFDKSVPVVELRKAPTTTKSASLASGSILYQSFQMSPQGASNQPLDLNTVEKPEQVKQHSVAFAIAEPVELYIPAISNAVLARIKVRQLPIPQVALTTTDDREDPWPDDQPLNLHIEVKAENPLQTVRLVIKSGTRTAKELVANVMTEDKKDLSTDYRLTLEQYVESDLAEVEIVAEAIDRAVPTPLIGFSAPLKLNTASAYGRYRQTLQTLREFKQKLDDNTAKQQPRLATEAVKLVDKAAQQSDKSPYFDGMDRMQIHKFQAQATELAQADSAEGMLDLSGTLNDFLFEHEILDDRERDRDFFVAARGLSRLIEQDPSKRALQLKTVHERMRSFLNDRYERWGKRVDRLAVTHKPAAWSAILQQKPFHAALNQIGKLEVDLSQKTSSSMAAHNKSEQLTTLSKMVVDYRTWIEALEKSEDSAREAEDKQRQEGLASARNTLRELQLRQGEISGELDRAAERPKSELLDQWPGARMKQNTNTQETRRLESQMRSLSPTAGERIKAAVESMEATTTAGNQGEFELAETNADLAGRLLRQAESAAAQSQQKRRGRGRRRSVTGDNYYGQSVVGGDIEIHREYQVDRRYREDILDEVQSSQYDSQYDDEQRVMIENYLRQVVR